MGKTDFQRLFRTALGWLEESCRRWRFQGLLRRLADWTGFKVIYKVKSVEKQTLLFGILMKTYDQIIFTARIKNGDVDMDFVPAAKVPALSENFQKQQNTNSFSGMSIICSGISIQKK